MNQRLGTRHELTEEERERIRVRLRERGVSQPALAKHLGVSVARVKNMLRDAGGQTRPLRWSPAELDGLRAIVAESAPWPSAPDPQDPRLDSVTAERVRRYFGDHSSLSVGTMLAVEALVSNPERWPDSVLAAFCRAVEPKKTPVPNSR